MSEESLNTLFETFDTWRHLPSYKLEPRVDAFIALYLPTVLAEHTGLAFGPIIIPEFPVRKGTLDGDDDNSSVKVDFALFTKDSSTCFLVEIKTDQASRRETQDSNMDRIAKIGFGPLVEGLLVILKATDKKYLQKYAHLLNALRRLELVEFPIGVAKHLYPNVTPDAWAALSMVTLTNAARRMAVRIAYVQPQSDQSPNVIGFDQFAAVITKQPGPLAQILATYLMKWTTTAGPNTPSGLP
jgi:hypothetical protein